MAQICRERDIKDTLYYKWRQTFLENSESIFAPPKPKQDQGKDERIAELERMVGRLTMEIEVLKKGKHFLTSDWRQDGR